MSTLLEQSSRVALAAFLHDMGKFAERARIETPKETIDINKQLYCPHVKNFADDPGYFTHVHAAYSAIALDILEKHFPELKGEDMFPFSAWKSADVDDSLINAAAKHHKPQTFMQWIVATADRVASGFEREEFEKYNQAKEGTVTGKNHYTARQLTLFEQIELDVKKKKTRDNFRFRYPLKPLSPEAIFPVEAKEVETNNKQQAQTEYLQLWNQFLETLQEIPRSHRQNLTLWLDHFETLWATFTHAIPAATAFNVRPEVSLYDHSRTTASLATALWRFHNERQDPQEDVVKSMRGRAQDWQANKFLLIQGDFFGIQDFIFTSGGETQKRAAKLLRGRSFYVSLLAECAALKVLDALDLPPTSQVINAAGKFLIVAPNTDSTLQVLGKIQKEIDNWFLEHTWGQSGIGIAWLSASCNDFRHGAPGAVDSPFRTLMKRLFEQLERAKYQQYQLCEAHAPAVFAEFLDGFNSKLGACQVDGRSPASVEIDKDVFVSELAKDQIDTGAWLTRRDRVLITRESLHMDASLKVPLFGFFVNFTGNEEVSGKFGNQAREGNLLRAWDFSLPESADQPLWRGYARRYINAYVPRFDSLALEESAFGKYPLAVVGEEKFDIGDPKTLNHIACEDRVIDRQGNQLQGIAALMTLKGDVDNVGAMFQRGLGAPTFAKMAGLSRQMNAFFAIYLPWLCTTDSQFRNCYTVFAGGDDFFLIGPWLSQIRLAKRLRSEFNRYVANNPEIHFSAGLSITKPGLPINSLASMAEDALESAKKHNLPEKGPAPKNAVTCFNRHMFWDEFEVLLQRQQRLNELTLDLGLSTGYIYGLLNLVDMAERVAQKPENALWHSYFAYRTRRMLERRRGLSEEQRQRLHQELADEIANKGIEVHSGNYRVALFAHLYQQRS